MDEFNYSSTYSSGWRQIKREETENEQQKAVSLPQKELGAPIRFSKQLSEDASPNQKKAAGNTISMPVLEENQKEIMDKINQLQAEMASMKQILHSIKTNTELMGLQNHRKAPGGKLPKLFK